MKKKLLVLVIAGLCVVCGCRATLPDPQTTAATAVPEPSSAVAETTAATTQTTTATTPVTEATTAAWAHLINPNPTGQRFAELAVIHELEGELRAVIEGFCNEGAFPEFDDVSTMLFGAIDTTNLFSETLYVGEKSDDDAKKIEEAINALVDQWVHTASYEDLNDIGRRSFGSKNAFERWLKVYEDGTLAEQLEHTKDIKSNMQDNTVSCEKLNDMGKVFFGDDFRFPPDFESSEIFSWSDEWSDDEYLTFLGGRAGVFPFSYLLTDIKEDGETFVATAVPYREKVDWENGITLGFRS